MIYDNQYEQLVLGLMITHSDAALKGINALTSDHFFDPNLRIVFNGVSFLVNNQKEVNIYNLNEYLKDNGQVLSLDSLINLEDKFYIEEKLDTILDILIDYNKKRSTIKELQKLKQDLEKSSSSYENIVKDINLLSSTEIKDSEQQISKDNYIKARDRHDYEKRTRIPILTGFKNIDSQLTYKLGLKEISIIAARPSNGKSTLKANIIKNMCLDGLGVVSYTLEQSMEVETDRLESIHSGIPIVEIANNHKWDKNDKRREILNKTRKEISTWNLYWINGFGKTFTEMSTELKFLKRKGISIVFWDLYDRMKEINISITNKAQAVSRMLQNTLALSNELNMHFCLLVQLNRETAKKKDPRPLLHELKDSGAYEEVARTVFLLHDPGFYNEALINPNLEVVIAKQSNGPKTKIDLEFRKENLYLVDKNIEMKPLKGITPLDSKRGTD